MRIHSFMQRPARNAISAVAIVAALGIAASAVAPREGHSEAAFSPYVAPDGTIRVPPNYRTDWIFVGTWSIASQNVERSAQAGAHGAAGLHNVYTQRSTLEAYRNTGKFPDGAVFVKELLTTKTAPMTTGIASRGDAIEGWFIMIKDTEGRFEGHPLWGDGWGWALFDVDNKLKTKNYEADCIACHLPAKQSDWIYIEGYPLLK